MMTHQHFRSLRGPALAVLALSLSACSSTRSKSDPPRNALLEASTPPAAPEVFVTDDGTRVVRVYDQSAAMKSGNGGRNITALQLPKEILVTPPDWIVNPGLDGVLGSVGVSPRNDLGTGVQIGSARTQARVELANMLEIRLQDVGRSDLEQYLRVLRDSGEAAPSNDSRSSLLGVQRNITDVVLSGSRQRAMWFDPSNGDCFVWMVMDGAVPGFADHEVENGVSVYVANTPIQSEYRPQRPEVLRAAPEAAPVLPEPVQVELTPTEALEQNLNELETIPVSEEGAQPRGQRPSRN